MEIVVKASGARATSTGVDRGVDVDVVVELPGGAVTGEVTLLPAEDGRPVYESWGGSPDYWVSGDLLSELIVASEGPDGLDADVLRGMLRTLAGEASAVAGRP